MTDSIQSRLSREDYDAIQATSITRLKELRRSPLHYRYALTHPKESSALTLGIATHVAVLEPERFEKDFAVWTNRTEAGACSPRRGKVWDEFAALHAGKTILKDDDAQLAQAIALAVRSDPIAMKYLAVGDPEISMHWQMGKRACKGRADWLTSIKDGPGFVGPTLVGLKTSRDCRHMMFGSQAAKLGYHLQWGFYHDGFETITGGEPHMVEIVVESDAPHAVATFIIPNDIIEQGREEYQALLRTLDECEASGEWPGPVTTEEFLTLPTWAYARDDEDLSDLGLEQVA